MAEKHFFEQEKYTNEYLIDYFAEHIKNFENKGINILEIGGGEGGLISALYKKGYNAEGMEISESRVNTAKKYLPREVKMLVGDITTKNIQFDKKYDLIIMRDVIEHIEKKQSAFDNIYSLLAEDGSLFITFPLKYSSYAGHQQNSKTWLRYVLFISLLPRFLIKLLCRLTNENSRYEGFLYIKKCALSYKKFRRLIGKKWKIKHYDLYLSRPIFKQRFGWPIIKMPNIPIIRELSSSLEAVLIKKK